MQMQMQMSSIGGDIFPVFFFDGERENIIGNVVVSPTMTFKAFQLIISQKIGISPHQITIYLEKPSSSPPPPFALPFKGHRKIPVTSKFNFGSISGDSHCSFRAVLKRSRRARRRRSRKQSTPMTMIEDDEYEDFDAGYSVDSGFFSPENFVLLRRNTTPAPDSWYPVSDYLDYENRMRVMEREKARYLVSLSLNSNVYTGIDFELYSNNNNTISDDGASSSCGSRDRVVCELCENHDDDGGGETSAAFHWCKYDAVIEGYFRSLAGPIARPNRREENAEVS